MTLMSSEHPFDDQLQQSFDGFEPEVHAPWAALERSLDGAEAAEATSSPGRGMNRWAVAASVAAGGALMWLGKPAVDDLIVGATEVPSEMRSIQAGLCPSRTRQCGFFRVGLGSAAVRDADIPSRRVGRGLEAAPLHASEPVESLVEAMTGALDNAGQMTSLPQRWMTRFPASRRSYHRACHSLRRRTRRVRGWKCHSNCLVWTSR